MRIVVRLGSSEPVHNFVVEDAGTWHRRHARSFGWRHRHATSGGGEGVSCARLDGLRRRGARRGRMPGLCAAMVFDRMSQRKLGLGEEEGERTGARTHVGLMHVR